MSILIKGMEMPKCCKDCFGCKADLFSDNGIACVVYLCQFTRTATGEEGVLDICPLVEVPTHGRLIDADALKKKWLEAESRMGADKVINLPLREYISNGCVYDLDQAQTIIEEEGGT